MQIKEVSLAEVLEFRDRKAMIQRNMLALDEKGIIVSLGLNIAGPIKYSASILSAFHEGMGCIEKMAAVLQADILKIETIEGFAGCAAIYLMTGVESICLKKASVEIESRHLLGRILDIDIIDSKGNSLTREEVGAKRRTCLICENDAKVCGRNRTHTIEELQEKTFDIIKKWQNQKALEIGEKAYRALIDEVHTTPKPGLVDLYSCGAHLDMDVEMFEKSAETLEPYFVEMVSMGMQEECTEEELFLRIRAVGMKAEEAMFLCTNGVNTHKGLIFTLGIYCAAIGRILVKDGKITPERIRNVQLKMTKERLVAELVELKENKPISNGEKNLMKYGTAGIRGEAINGYPTIWEVAYPVMHQGLKEKRDYNLVRLQTLLHIMAHIEDSNILSRKDLNTLLYVQKQAENMLENGGVYNPENYQKLYKMDTEYILKNISPGGAADVLAATIFMEMVLND